MGASELDLLMTLEELEQEPLRMWMLPTAFCYPTRGEATIDDLYQVPEKRRAELVNGRILVMPFFEALPARANSEIAYSLMNYEDRAVGGRTFTATIAYVVDLPRRKSFSPTVSFYTGPPSGMKFPKGVPVFAAEVRGGAEYGPVAEEQRAAKRIDYFTAGTLVVWDVDLLGEDVVKVYRASDPDNPTIYRRGDMAEAEPVVPGWTMAVDELFN